MDFGKGDSSWFTHDRFGMFIHWGIYSMHGRGEWQGVIENMSDEQYENYYKYFDPDLFDAKIWAKAAREAGMKYVVFTVKHHEGFCMYDSEFTDYKSTTACGRDLLREIVDAFRAEGLRIGLYYSLIDWHHPHFEIDVNHPYRERDDRDELNKTRNMDIYRQYIKDQTREILTKYGDIDIGWFDFSYPHVSYNPKGREAWDSEGLVKLIRSIRPSIMLNNRLDLPGGGDIVTPEQNTPEEPILDENGNVAVWEGCQTFGGSWGYKRDEYTWKSEKQCIDMLVNHVSRGGNLLMNVGPTSRGFLDDRAMTGLGYFAKWMKYNSAAIYGCGAAPGLTAPDGCRYTWNPKTNRLYLHIYSWPFRYLELPQLGGKVRYAQLLHDMSEILFDEASDAGTFKAATAAGNISLKLPVQKPDIVVPVVEIILKEPLA